MGGQLALGGTVDPRVDSPRGTAGPRVSGPGGQYQGGTYYPVTTVCLDVS